MLRIKTGSAAILIFMIFTVRAYSSLGVITYYSYWEPAYMKAYKNSKVDPVLLIGPVISTHFFKDWTLSLQVIYSVNDFNSEFTIYVPSAGDATFKTKSRRADSEGSVMYSFNSYLKIFGGYKTCFISEMSSDMLKGPSGYTSEYDLYLNDFWLHGPEAGIAFLLPLGENLKISLRTSLLYYNMEHDTALLYIPVLNIIGTEDWITYKYHGYGNNSALEFTYFFPSIDTAINLGAQCQYIKYKSKGDAPELDSDLNYGVTLSAMYFIF